MAREIKVLVVDDNDSAREVISECARMILAEMGFDPDFVLFDDSRDALVFLEEGACFDLVLSDLRCNPVNQQEDAGFSIIQMARRNAKECIGFIITANELERGLVLKGVSYGVARMFRKPFNLVDLEIGFKEHLLVA